MKFDIVWLILSSKFRGGGGIKERRKEKRRKEKGGRKKEEGTKNIKKIFPAHSRRCCPLPTTQSSTSPCTGEDNVWVHKLEG